MGPGFRTPEWNLLNYVDCESVSLSWPSKKRMPYNLSITGTNIFMLDDPRCERCTNPWQSPSQFWLSAQWNHLHKMEDRNIGFGFMYHVCIEGRSVLPSASGTDCNCKPERSACYPYRILSLRFSFLCITITHFEWFHDVGCISECKLSLLEYSYVSLHKT